MRPPSSQGFSVSNESLFNAIDFFAPRTTNNKQDRYLGPQPSHLPILNSLHRPSLTPSTLSSPQHRKGVLNDRTVKRFFRGNDSPRSGYSRPSIESSTSEIQSISSVIHVPNPTNHINNITHVGNNKVARNEGKAPLAKSTLTLGESCEEPYPLYGEKWLPMFTVLPTANWADASGKEKCQHCCAGFFNAMALLFILFLFLITHELLSVALTLIMGKAYMNVIIHRHVSWNPMGLLMFGILSGVFTESFIYPTSIVAKLIENEQLPLNKGIFILYGLHIGVTAACLFVALTFLGSKHKLRRASASAILYYIVNLFTVIVLLPFEVVIGMVSNLTEFMLRNVSWTPKNSQVLRTLVLGVTDYIAQIDFHIGASFKENARWIRNCTYNHTSSHCIYLFRHPSRVLSDGVMGLLLLIIVILLWCLCLFSLVKIINILLRGNLANKCQDITNNRLPVGFPWCGEFAVCLLMGGLTVVVQYPSVIMTFCTLLAARGVLGISRMFSIVIGCNLGNSLSLVLISLSDQSQTLFHLSIMCVIYNILGFFAWFITPCMRRLMVNAAAKMGENMAQYRWLHPVFIAIILLIVPAILTGLSAAGLGIFLIVTIPVAIVFIYVVIVNAVLQYNPKLIPERLRIWRFLPEFCHSLEPYDKFFMQYSDEHKLRRQQRRNNQIKERFRKGDPLEFWERSRVPFYKTEEPYNLSCHNQSGSTIGRMPLPHYPSGAPTSVYI